MNCCICGAVKNCGPYLEKVFTNIEKIGSLFNDYRIILYYDTSQDNTLDLLKQYKQKNNKLIFYVNKKEISSYRTIRIANARNNCLQVIRNIYADYPFFIMMDLDDVCSQDIKLEVLQRYLDRNDWDALSFNKDIYYDIWALSIKPYFLSCMHFKIEVCSIMQKYITRLLKHLPSGELLPCASAFNGFAIYRTDKFLDCRYNGVFNIGIFSKNKKKYNIGILNSSINYNVIEDCEHRSFHVEAINRHNAKIRISSDILF